MRAARIVAYVAVAVVSAVLLLKVAFWLVSPDGQIWLGGGPSPYFAAAFVQGESNV